LSDKTLSLTFVALFCHQEKLCIAILETYVKQLIEEHQVALIATYTATLPQDLQIECYAKFLEGLDLSFCHFWKAKKLHINLC